MPTRVPIHTGMFKTLLFETPGLDVFVSISWGSFWKVVDGNIPMDPDVAIRGLSSVFGSPRRWHLPLLTQVAFRCTEDRCFWISCAWLALNAMTSCRIFASKHAQAPVRSRASQAALKLDNSSMLPISGPPLFSSRFSKKRRLAVLRGAQRCKQ